MSPDQWGAFLPILVILLAFWFLVIRPARKRQQQALRLQNSIAVGERVMLTSGIFGRVAELGTETLELEISSGVVVTAHRQAVARVVEPEPADDADVDRSGAVDRTDGRDAQA